MTSQLEHERQLFLDWLREACLPCFAGIGRDQRAGFHETVGADGKPVLGASRRLRVQARQAYSYAAAERLGLFEGGQEVSDWAVDALMGDGLQPAAGGCPRGFAHRLGPQGEVLDNRRDLYDHAFVLLAASERRRVYGPTKSDLAADIAWEVCAALENAHGGWNEGCPAVLPRRQNPHMHLLEASLAWREAGGDQRAEDAAAEILGLWDRHFWDRESRVLREFFTDDWTVHPQRGHLIEPGHMLEWVWLLHTADHGNTELLTTLFDRARALGAADHEQIIANTVDLKSGSRSEGFRLWPQTEHIRAALVLAHRTDELRYQQAAAEALAALRRLYLPLEPAGCYHDEIADDGSVRSDQSPASLVYHLITLAEALINLR